MFPTNFQFIWASSFREEDFQKFSNQKQELPVAAMFVNGSGRNQESSYTTFHRCFATSFGSFEQAVSEEKIQKNLTYQKNELPMASMFANGLGKQLAIFIENLPLMLNTQYQFI